MPVLYTSHSFIPLKMKGGSKWPGGSNMTTAGISVNNSKLLVSYITLHSKLPNHRFNSIKWVLKNKLKIILINKGYL